ncbi:hypothetical protein JNE170426_23830 [Escherichia coli]|nr:hypothetical protein JNE170426_23830 [Escherichia coli]
MSTQNGTMKRIIPFPGRCFLYNGKYNGNYHVTIVIKGNYHVNTIGKAIASIPNAATRRIQSTT